MKKIAVLLCSILMLLSCEKDDICDQATTPKMVFSFYDITDTSLEKSPVDFAIFGEGFETEINQSVNGANDSFKAGIPLKTSVDSSTFLFIQNYTDENETNTDTLTVNYSRNEVYVSRGCGFKTNFTLNDTNGVALTADTDNWIQNIEIENSIITNETTVHVKIYF